MTTENFSEAFAKNVNEAMKSANDSMKLFQESASAAISSFEKLSKQAGENFSSEFKKTIDTNLEFSKKAIESSVNANLKLWSDMLKGFTSYTEKAGTSGADYRKTGSGTDRKTTVNKEIVQN